MKRIFLALLLMVGTAQAATISFQMTNVVVGQAFTNDLIVQPITQPIFDGSWVVNGLPIRFRNPTGVTNKVLQAGNYELRVVGLNMRTNFLFAVPSGTDTWNISDPAIWISGGNIFNYTPGVRTLITSDSITVSNLGSGSFSLHSTNSGGGSGVFTAGGTNILATTNGTVVTVNALTDTNIVRSLATNAAQSVGVGYITNSTGTGTNTTLYSPTNRVRVNFAPVVPPATALSAAHGIAGAVTSDGIYVVTYVTADGETTPGPENGADEYTDERIDLTNIPIAPAGQSVTARRIYRKKAADSLFYLVTTINDNTTTIYTDNVADASLGAAVPHYDTTGGFVYIGEYRLPQVKSNWSSGYRDEIVLGHNGQPLILRTIRTETNSAANGGAILYHGDPTAMGAISMQMIDPTVITNLSSLPPRFTIHHGNANSFRFYHDRLTVHPSADHVVFQHAGDGHLKIGTTNGAKNLVLAGSNMLSVVKGYLSLSSFGETNLGMVVGEMRMGSATNYVWVKTNRVEINGDINVLDGINVGTVVTVQGGAVFLGDSSHGITNNDGALSFLVGFPDAPMVTITNYNDPDLGTNQTFSLNFGVFHGDGAGLTNLNVVGGGGGLLWTNTTTIFASPTSTSNGIKGLIEAPYSISNAFRAAAVGDTIVLLPGVYNVTNRLTNVVSGTIYNLGAVNWWNAGVTNGDPECCFVLKDNVRFFNYGSISNKNPSHASAIGIRNVDGDTAATNWVIFGGDYDGNSDVFMFSHTNVCQGSIIGAKTRSQWDNFVSMGALHQIKIKGGDFDINGDGYSNGGSGQRAAGVVVLGGQIEIYDTTIKAYGSEIGQNNGLSTQTGTGSVVGSWIKFYNGTIHATNAVSMDTHIIELFNSQTNGVAITSSNLLVGTLAGADHRLVQAGPDGTLYAVMATNSVSGSGSPGGDTGMVQYNDDGAFAGESAFMWVEDEDRLDIGASAEVSIDGISGNITALGDVLVGSGPKARIFGADGSAGFADGELSIAGSGRIFGDKFSIENFDDDHDGAASFGSALYYDSNYFQIVPPRTSPNPMFNVGTNGITYIANGQAQILTNGVYQSNPGNPGNINGQFIAGDVSNTNCPTCDHTAIGGGTGNSVLAGDKNVIGGGEQNEMYGALPGSVGQSVIGGGSRNYIRTNHTEATQWSGIGSGRSNIIDHSQSFIGGGVRNIIAAREAAILGGISNSITADRATIIGNYQTNSTAGSVNINGAYVLENGEIRGNGAGLTNIWTRQVIAGGFNAIVIAGSRFGPVDGMVGTSPNSVIANQIRLATPSLGGGYLSNLVVWSSVQWPSGTNVVFTIQTNTGIATPVSTPLTCTLEGSFAKNHTNSGAAFVNLPSLDDGNAYNWVMGVNTTSSGGNIAAQMVAWSVEWWHQSP